MVELAVSLIIALTLVVGVFFFFRRRKAAEARGAQSLKLALAEGQSIPLSLHPVIDPVLCVGSFSCLKACPEGEVIGVVDGVATLVEPSHCIGHGTCADECPVGAIKLVFGTAERGVDLPELDDKFESSRRGLFIVGELGGMGLIKNALKQGLLVGKAIKSRLPRAEAGDIQATDVVVVGGGPAGIASAISCMQQGLSVRVFEQESLGGAIAHYPRGKVVMTEQIDMPGYGPFGRSLLTKEELMTELSRLVKKNKVAIEEGQKVTRVEGDFPFFSVTTARGDRVQCRAVVLAIGLRGTPRKLDAPGEEQSKVVYRLVDPEQYHGRSVLVVGGGDSAVEAAIQLAEESTAKVSISHRSKAFNRCKPRNREKIQRLIEEGRIKAYFSSKVSKIDPAYVHIMPAGKEKDGEAEQQKDKDKATATDRGDAPAKADARPARVEKPLRVEKPEPGKSDDLFPPLPPTVALDPDITDPLGARPTLDAVVRAAAAADEPIADPGKTRVELDPSASVRRPDKAGGSSFRTRQLDDQSSSNLQTRTRLTPRLAVKGSVLPLDGDASTSSTPQRKGSGLVERLSSLRAPRPKIDAMSASVPRPPAAEPGGMRIKNDAVIVNIGGELPTEFLQALRVDTRKYLGQEKSASKAGVRGPSKAEVEARTRRRLALTLFSLGATILIGLWYVGREYYWLPPEERVESPLHSLLRPSGLWGHGVGVVATLFMMTNFIYAARKRWRLLKGKASIRTWLTFHMFVGLMSPLVIAFHSAFLANNLLAIWTWVSLVIVVGTGIFGRFLFGLVPARSGRMLAVAELREQVSDIAAVLQPKIMETTNIAQVTQIFDMANSAPVEKTVVKVMVREVTGRHKLVEEVEKARGAFKDEKAFDFFRNSIIELARARTQISFYAKLKRIFRGWLVFHVILSIFMVFLIGAHVAVTTYLGFGALFSRGGP